MTNLPDRPLDPTGLPERQLSSKDFEMVIRRAAELQAKDAEEGTGGDSMSGAEVIRIGRELGLSTRHLHQALAEVGGSGATESGLFARLFGPASVIAGRTVPGRADEVARKLEAYLVEREFLAVLRRLPDRVLFTRATGVAAALGRASSQIFSRSPLLKVANLEMAVQPLEDSFAYVNLATSLGSHRNGTAAVSFLGGGSGAASAAAVLGIAIAPPAALLALPVLVGAVYGGHLYFENLVRSVQLQLDSLLDRIEHGDLPVPTARWSAPRR